MIAALIALWAIVGLVITHVVFGINAPVELFDDAVCRVGNRTAASCGRWRRIGPQYSGCAAHAQSEGNLTGLDIYSGYWGIDNNTPERFMSNARIAGAADRAEARTGDMRDMPFKDGEFDAAMSVAAIDHLREEGIPKTLGEMSRVLKPRGEVLLMIVNPDWVAMLASPHAIAHHRRQDPERWRSMLPLRRFLVEQEGTQAGTL